jgi:diguanylate cyclase (GGDEF)-like protein
VYVLPSTGKKGSREAETRIHQAFEDPFSVKGRSLKLTASVGIAVFPDDGKTIRELLIVADEKMYENKEKLSRESKRVTIT